jgi:hypothetical protein
MPPSSRDKHDFTRALRAHIHAVVSAPELAVKLCNAYVQARADGELLDDLAGSQILAKCTSHNTCPTTAQAVGFNTMNQKRETGHTQKSSKQLGLLNEWRGDA